MAIAPTTGVDLLPIVCFFWQPDLGPGQAFEALQDYKYVIASESEVVSAEELRFNYLVEKWHEERGITSFVAEMIDCQSYKDIIAMGKAITSLIFKRLQAEESEPDFWFEALEELTSANPVAEEDRGDILVMAQAWLEWGREHYTW